MNSCLFVQSRLRDSACSYKYTPNKIATLTQKKTLKITDDLSYFEYMHFDQIRLIDFDSQGKKF